MFIFTNIDNLSNDFLNFPNFKFLGFLLNYPVSIRLGLQNLSPTLQLSHTLSSSKQSSY